ncbi:hypothetical protein HG536_0A01150 [Torulaspora globosa]|uniref:MICOS complex subunit n=1 Tax=Torulaspora globosa TaxID=48254 RepID=A0A7G3Z9W2_9SACH|nr:uncharacterized protein HG536_0A01150 [Torulaspora globosa]QLL30298.1 hypothetical protein HG536_0A01150 [Torulaspora globosa]
MTAGSRFYREQDLVKEAVIPRQNGMVLSSDAKQAVLEPLKSSKTATARAMSIIGNNELIDGISVRSPTYLLSVFHRLRLRVSRTIEKATQKIDKKTSAYYRHERRLTSTIASLHSDPRERLLPGFTYIIVAAMSGSVLTRNKRFLYRFTAPLVLGSACFSYVLPTTFQNTAALLHSIESAHFPRAVAKQDAIINKTVQIGRTTASHIDYLAESVFNIAAKFRHSVKEWTNLNIE